MANKAKEQEQGEKEIGSFTIIYLCLYWPIKLILPFTFLFDKCFIYYWCTIDYIGLTNKNLVVIYIFNLVITFSHLHTWKLN